VLGIYSRVREVTARTLAGVTACGILLITGWAVWRILWAGPGVRVHARNGSTVLDTTLLGDYQLGLTRVKVLDGASGTVVADLASERQDLPSIIILTPSVRTTTPVPTAGELVFPVVPGRYHVTLCGNNGFARFNCTTRRVRVGS
jgi:hypothetical protein